jgi:hypothetical protein
MTGLTKNPLAGLAALGLAGAIPTNTGAINPTGLYYGKSILFFLKSEPIHSCHLSVHPVMVSFYYANLTFNFEN